MAEKRPSDQEEKKDQEQEGRLGQDYVEIICFRNKLWVTSPIFKWSVITSRYKG